MTEIRCAIEVRQDAERRGPGRLVGTLLTYGERASDRAETFARNSLRWPEDGVVLCRQHAGDRPIMRVTPAVEGDRVVIDAALPDTTAGRDAAREVRDGLFRGLSVEFRALRHSYTGGVRTVTDALLTGAGLVSQPAYSGSTAEVRTRRKVFYL